jgi:hypothetical protein
MKAFKLLAICLVIFATVPVFACGGGKECDKDKDKDKDCDKDKPAPQCGGSRCNKDKRETKT